MSARFIIEGTWSGYIASQRRVVHRTVHSAIFKILRAWAENTHAIHYQDGTALCISVRDCKPRERVREIHGYDSLIYDCYFHKVDSVAALYAIKNRKEGGSMSVPKKSAAPEFSPAATPETVSPAVCPVAGPLDPDPTHWSNWRTRGDGYGDTAGGMPLKTGE